MLVIEKFIEFNINLDTKNEIGNIADVNEKIVAGITDISEDIGDIVEDIDKIKTYTVNPQRRPAPE